MNAFVSTREVAVSWPAATHDQIKTRLNNPKMAPLGGDEHRRAVIATDSPQRLILNTRPCAPEVIAVGQPRL